ncbi:MAG TPA: ABC transporter permease [Gemmatimonadales bacterium]|jgi:predicted permease
MSWIDRVTNLLRPERLSRDLDVEIDTHLGERTDDLVAAGMSPLAARAEARRRFGNRGRKKESAHDVDTLAWLESVAADLRYAVRTLRNSPGFTAVAVLSLALGVGANTAIFSLVDAITLRSLPVSHPEQLLQLDQGKPNNNVFTNPLWEAVRDRSAGFTSAFAYGDEQFNLANGGAVDFAQGLMVSGGFFDALGVRPIAGRLTHASDDVRGCTPMAMVSAGFAERRLGGTAGAVGRTVALDGHPVEVIGVVDPRFSGLDVGRRVDIYAPLCAYGALSSDPGMLDGRSTWYLNIMLRPNAGMALPAVNAQLAQLAPIVYRTTVPGDWAATGRHSYLQGKLSATPSPAGVSDLRDNYRAALTVLMIVVGALLLIACANIANLLLARATARQREMAIRLAIGAARRRLVRQLLTESLLLAGTGAVIGVIFARWASRLLMGFLSTQDQPVAVDLSINARVLGFTIAIATVTGVLFGLLPAWRAARTDPQSAMKAGGAVRGAMRRGLGRVLVTGQVALSLALVVSAGLLLGSFERLVTLDPGFQRDGILLTVLDFTPTGLKDHALVTVSAQLLQQVRQLPGVSSASLSWTTPIARGGWNDFVRIPGYRPVDMRDSLANFNQVSDGYFHTLGTPLLAGRDISGDDVAGNRSVVVINRTMAMKMFGSASPLGRTFTTPAGDSASPPRDVIGVVGDAKYSRLTQPAPPTGYFPVGIGGLGNSTLTLEVRSTRPFAGMIRDITRLAASTSPAITLRFTTLAQQVSDSLTRPRLLAALGGFFGLLALLLAMIGLYGTMAYHVTRRRSEIGLRMALGAGRLRVMRTVVGEANRIVLIGVVLGIALALMGTRVLASLLYGVTATDTGTVLGSAVLLLITGAIAAAIPAWRATRVDPVQALREG